jgi:endoglucanase
MGSAPYTAVISGTATLTSKLEPVLVAGIAPEGYTGGTVNLALQLGQVGQPVVLSAPFVLRNYKQPAAPAAK